MDIELIHQFLNEASYWAEGISIETVKTALENSFCVGVFNDDAQVGFARFVTDYSTFAYLADVFVLDKFRGQGLSKLMVGHMVEKDWAKGLRRILLATLDAHSLYKKFGFTAPQDPGTLMEIKRNDVYKNPVQ